MIQYRNKIELINVAVKSLYDEIMEQNPDGNPFMTESCYAFVPQYIREFMQSAYRSERTLAINSITDTLGYDYIMNSCDRVNGKWVVSIYNRDTNEIQDYYV